MEVEAEETTALEHLVAKVAAVLVRPVTLGANQEHKTQEAAVEVEVVNRVATAAPASSS